MNKCLISSQASTSNRESNKFNFFSSTQNKKNLFAFVSKLIYRHFSLFLFFLFVNLIAKSCSKEKFAPVFKLDKRIFFSHNFFGINLWRSRKSCLPVYIYCYFIHVLLSFLLDDKVPLFCGSIRDAICKINEWIHI